MVNAHLYVLSEQRVLTSLYFIKKKKKTFYVYADSYRINLAPNSEYKPEPYYLIRTKRNISC